MNCFNLTQNYNITLNIKETHNVSDCQNGTLVKFCFNYRDHVVLLTIIFDKKQAFSYFLFAD